MVCVSVCIGVLKHTLTVGGLSKVTSDRAGVGDGGRKGLSLSLLSNVHFQGPGLNVSEIIGAPRRYSLSS